MVEYDSVRNRQGVDQFYFYFFIDVNKKFICKKNSYGRRFIILVLIFLWLYDNYIVIYYKIYFNNDILFDNLVRFFFIKCKELEIG